MLDPYVQRIRAIGVVVPPTKCVWKVTLDPQTVLQPLEAHLRSRTAKEGILIPRLERVIYHPSWDHEIYFHLLLHSNLLELELPTVTFSVCVYSRGISAYSEIDEVATFSV